MNADSGIYYAYRGILDKLQGFGVDFLPRLLAALAILVVGALLAKLAGRIVRKTLERIHFDALMQRVGIMTILAGIGVKGALSHLLGQTLYYFLLLLFVQASARSLGLDSVSDAVEAFFGYLPQLVAAFLIFVIGNLVAQTTGRLVETAARESGVEMAPSLGRIVSGLILFIAVIMAVGELGIETGLIRIFVIASLAGSALAFGLSFGLGTRSVTHDLVAGYYVRKSFTMGAPVRIGEDEGTLRAVTPTKTFLDRDGEMISVPNRRLLEERTTS